MAAMENREKLQARQGFTKMGTYVKEVDVTFSVSASGEVSESGDISGIEAGAAKVGLKLAGDYKSAKGNTITFKFASLLDNDPFTSNRVDIAKGGRVLVRQASGGTTGQAKPKPTATGTASAKPVSTEQTMVP